MRGMIWTSGCYRVSVDRGTRLMGGDPASELHA